jgi:hypothetical protein
MAESRLRLPAEGRTDNSSDVQPKGKNQARVHICSPLDSALRISEALSITKQDCDLDNLVIKIMGKRENIDLFRCRMKLGKTIS